MLKVQFAKYLAVGISNALLGYIVYAVLISVGAGILLALFFNYVFCIFFSFTINRSWVFNANGWNQLPLYFTFQITILIINYALIGALTEQFNISKYLAQALLIAPLALLNFGILKFIIFKYTHHKPSIPAANIQE